MGQIDPVQAPAIWPWMKEPFGDWLFSGFQQKPDGGWNLSGAPAYPGQLSPSFDQTRLPEAWSAWQPMDAGTMYLAQQTANNGLGVGKHDPLSDQMMQWGGAGGIGNNYMNMMAQYGTPSQVGQPLQTMIQHGYANQGSGGNLAALAAGNPSGAASFLVPFLTGQMGGQNSYTPPDIQPRQVQRRA